MAVHWTPDSKFNADKYDTIPNGGKLPDKPITARGHRRHEPKASGAKISEVNKH